MASRPPEPPKPSGISAASCSARAALPVTGIRLPTRSPSPRATPPSPRSRSISPRSASPTPRSSRNPSLSPRRGPPSPTLTNRSKPKPKPKSKPKSTHCARPPSPRSTTPVDGVQTPRSHLKPPSRTTRTPTPSSAKERPPQFNPSKIPLPATPPLPVIELEDECALESQVHTLRRTLSSVHDASARIHALRTFQSVIDGGAGCFATFATIVRSLCQPLRTQLVDPNVAVVKEACSVIGGLATTLGDALDEMAGELLPSLLQLVGNSTEEVSLAGGHCIHTILSYTRHRPLTLSILTASRDRKKLCMRLHAAKFLGQILHDWPSSKLEEDAQALENAISRLLVDSDRAVREVAYRSYWDLRNQWDDRGQRVLSKVDAATKTGILCAMKRRLSVFEKHAEANGLTTDEAQQTNVEEREADVKSTGEVEGAEVKTDDILGGAKKDDAEETEERDVPDVLEEEKKEDDSTDAEEKKEKEEKREDDAMDAEEKKEEEEKKEDDSTDAEEKKEKEEKREDDAMDAEEMKEEEEKKEDDSTDAEEKKEKEEKREDDAMDAEEKKEEEEMKEKEEKKEDDAVDAEEKKEKEEKKEDDSTDAEEKKEKEEKREDDAMDAEEKKEEEEMKEKEEKKEDDAMDAEEKKKKEDNPEEEKEIPQEADQEANSLVEETQNDETVEKKTFHPSAMPKRALTLGEEESRLSIKERIAALSQNPGPLSQNNFGSTTTSHHANLEALFKKVEEETDRAPSPSGGQPSGPQQLEQPTASRPKVVGRRIPQNLPKGSATIRTADMGNSLSQLGMIPPQELRHLALTRAKVPPECHRKPSTSVVKLAYFPSTNDMTDEELGRLTTALLRGMEFLKHGRKGKPHLRVVYCDTPMDRVLWRKVGCKKPRNHMLFRDISEVKLGQETRVFRRQSGRVGREGYSFSLIGIFRTLDLECFDSSMRDIYAQAFEKLINDARGIRKEAVPLLPDVEKPAEQTFKPPTTPLPPRPDIENPLSTATGGDDEIPGVPTAPPPPLPRPTRPPSMGNGREGSTTPLPPLPSLPSPSVG